MLEFFGRLLLIGLAILFVLFFLALGFKGAITGEDPLQEMINGSEETPQALAMDEAVTQATATPEVVYIYIEPPATPTPLPTPTPTVVPTATPFTGWRLWDMGTGQLVAESPPEAEPYCEGLLGCPGQRKILYYADQPVPGYDTFTEPERPYYIGAAVGLAVLIIILGVLLLVMWYTTKPLRSMMVALPKPTQQPQALPSPSADMIPVEWLASTLADQDPNLAQQVLQVISTTLTVKGRNNR